jgi:hypothetical protein
MQTRRVHRRVHRSHRGGQGHSRYITKTRNVNTYLRLSSNDRAFLKAHPHIAKQYTALIASTKPSTKATRKVRNQLIREFPTFVEERD